MCLVWKCSGWVGQNLRTRLRDFSWFHITAICLICLESLFEGGFPTRCGVIENRMELFSCPDGYYLSVMAGQVERELLWLMETHSSPMRRRTRSSRPVMKVVSVTSLLFKCCPDSSRKAEVDFSRAAKVAPKSLLLEPNGVDCWRLLACPTSTPATLGTKIFRYCLHGYLPNLSISEINFSAPGRLGQYHRAQSRILFTPDRFPSTAGMFNSVVTSQKSPSGCWKKWSLLNQKFLGLLMGDRNNPKKNFKRCKKNRVGSSWGSALAGSSFAGTECIRIL